MFGKRTEVFIVVWLACLFISIAAEDKPNKNDPHNKKAHAKEHEEKHLRRDHQDGSSVSHNGPAGLDLHGQHYGQQRLPHPGPGPGGYPDLRLGPLQGFRGPVPYPYPPGYLNRRQDILGGLNLSGLTELLAGYLAQIQQQQELAAAEKAAQEEQQRQTGSHNQQGQEQGPYYPHEQHGQQEQKQNGHRQQYQPGQQGLGLHGQQGPGLHGQQGPDLHGQQGSGLHGQQGSGLHGQQGSGLHGQQGTGLHGQQGTGLHGQQGSGLHGQQGSGLHGQQGSGLHGQQGSGLQGQQGHTNHQGYNNLQRGVQPYLGNLQGFDLQSEQNLAGRNNQESHGAQGQQLGQGHYNQQDPRFQQNYGAIPSFGGIPPEALGAIPYGGQPSYGYPFGYPSQLEEDALFREQRQRGPFRDLQGGRETYGPYGDDYNLRRQSNLAIGSRAFNTPRPYDPRRSYEPQRAVSRRNQAPENSSIAKPRAAVEIGKE